MCIIYIDCIILKIYLLTDLLTRYDTRRDARLHGTCRYRVRRVAGRLNPRATMCHEGTYSCRCQLCRMQRRRHCRLHAARRSRRCVDRCLQTT